MIDMKNIPWCEKIGLAVSDDFFKFRNINYNISFRADFMNSGNWNELLGVFDFSGEYF